MATLTHTVLFQFPLLLALGYLILSKQRFKLLPKLALFVGTFWLTLVPWMARNERIFDQPLLTTKSGVDFFMYNHNPLRYILLNYSLDDVDVFEGRKPWELSELERDRLCREAGVQWVKEHPLLFLFKGVRMQWNFFGVEREYVWSLIAGYWGRIPRWILGLCFIIFVPTIYVLMPLFIWGVVYSWNNYPRIINLIGITGYFLAVTFVYYGFSRHRSPLNPVIMAFAGYAITAGDKIVTDLKLPGFWHRPRVVIAVGILIFYVIGWLLEIVVDANSLLTLGFTHEGWKSIGAAE
jgi:hypothetical protein